MASTDCRKPREHQLLTLLASHVLSTWEQQAFRCKERSCNALLQTHLQSAHAPVIVVLLGQLL